MVGLRCLWVFRPHWCQDSGVKRGVWETGCSMVERELCWQSVSLLWALLSACFSMRIVAANNKDL